MFAFKIATILAVASVAFAMPTPGGDSCSTGTLQCCNSIAPSGSSNAASLAGLLPLNLQGLNVPMGLECIPINVIGVGSAGTCNAQTACCDNVYSSSAIGVNCSPINVGL